MNRTGYSTLFLTTGMVMLFALMTVQPLLGQSDTFENINFFYIDNSKTQGRNGLSTKMVEELSATLDSIKEVPLTKNWLFISDGDNPLVVENVEDFQSALRSLFDQNTAFPFFLWQEQINVMRVLYDSEIKATKSIKFHFYLTDSFLEEQLLDKNLFLLSNIPHDFRQEVGDREPKTEVRIISTSELPKTRLEQLMKKLSYADGFLPDEEKIIYSFQSK